MEQENHIKLHWSQGQNEKGYMERIILPTGEIILFNHEQEKIDFTPLLEYVGSPCDYYLDGEYRWTQRLERIGYLDGKERGRPDIEKLRTLFFEPLTE